MTERFVHVSMPDGRKMKFKTLKEFDKFMAKEEKNEAKRIKKLAVIKDTSVFKQIKDKKAKEKTDGI